MATILLFFLAWFDLEALIIQVRGIGLDVLKDVKQIVLDGRHVAKRVGYLKALYVVNNARRFDVFIKVDEFLSIGSHAGIWIALLKRQM
jgi:hypothetical protein